MGTQSRGGREPAAVRHAAGNLDAGVQGASRPGVPDGRAARRRGDAGVDQPARQRHAGQGVLQLRLRAVQERRRRHRRHLRGGHRRHRSDRGARSGRATPRSRGIGESREG